MHEKIKQDAAINMNAGGASSEQGGVKIKKDRLGLKTTEPGRFTKRVWVCRWVDPVV
jgi:hypothetical protein